MSDIFERTGEWLQMQALLDSDLSDILQAFGRRLLDGGMPVARIRLGRLLMHPVLGTIDATWEAETGHVSWFTSARDDIRTAFFEKSPFGDMSRAASELVRAGGFDRLRDGTFRPEQYGHIHADLTDPADRARYGVFQTLHEQGFTGYISYCAPFGERPYILKDGTCLTPGASMSFATKRRRGFTAADLDGFRRLVLPLAVCLRATSERYLAQVLMQTYLGRISGAHVLEGQIALGHSRRIDCALLYSDMRQSTRMSRELPAGEYVDHVNRYFDCVAGAVLEHGGEVLKFIGDGVLAIFPFDDQARRPEDMCRAALDTAQEAFARRLELAAPERMDFAIALHLGEVIYGNVGVASRMDFTATGSAVALVSRLEEMTRSLDARLLASAGFAELAGQPARDLGTHALRGFDDPVAIVAYDVHD